MKESNKKDARRRDHGQRNLGQRNLGEGEKADNSHSDMVIGRNPVIEALKSGRDMEKLMVQKGATGSMGKILSLAKSRGIVTRMVDKDILDRTAGGGSHQGVIAFVSVHEYATLDDILNLAAERGEDPFVVILDEVSDPHNLGAVMRTAECAGAHGVIISKRRASGITETVAKTSAGAVEYLPCARVANIGQAIGALKKRGVWVYACDMGGTCYYEQDMTGGVALVIGNEGSGISRLVREKCDYCISIPMVGKISSLNASNAAAILMYEVRKQRDAEK